MYPACPCEINAAGGDKGFSGADDNGRIAFWEIAITVLSASQVIYSVLSSTDLVGQRKAGVEPDYEPHIQWMFMVPFLLDTALKMVAFKGPRGYFGSILNQVRWRVRCIAASCAMPSADRAWAMRLSDGLLGHLHALHRPPFLVPIPISPCARCTMSGSGCATAWRGVPAYLHAVQYCPTRCPVLPYTLSSTDLAYCATRQRPDFSGFRTFRCLRILSLSRSQPPLSPRANSRCFLLNPPFSSETNPCLRR